MTPLFFEYAYFYDTDAYVGCYTDCDELKLKNAIYLVYELTELSKCKWLDNKLRKEKTYYNTYYTCEGNKEYMVYAFVLPDCKEREYRMRKYCTDSLSVTDYIDFCVMWKKHLTKDFKELFLQNSIVNNLTMKKGAVVKRPLFTYLLKTLKELIFIEWFIITFLPEFKPCWLFPI